MIELIPAIDIIEGKCVRLTKGDYDKCRVYGVPLDMAKAIEDYGFKRLHIVDLDGAKSKHIVNNKVLEEIAIKTNLIVDFGGGIKSDEDLRCAYDYGATLVTIGSLAVTNPEIFINWLKQYGADALILGADARNGFISINGWKEDSKQELIPFLQNYWSKGVKNVLCTDINRDGMLSGPAFDLYENIMKANKDCHLIASGGVSNFNDIKKLNEKQIPAVVFGKAIYEGKINLKELSDWMVNN